MQIVDLGKQLNYEEAGERLLEKVNLNNIQLYGLNHFLYNIIPRVLKRDVVTNKYRIRFVSWYLDPSKLLPEITCKGLGKTRQIELWVGAEVDLLGTSKEDGVQVLSTTSVNFLLDKIPMLSEMGSLIINGNEVNMVSHLGKPTGLYYEPKGGKDGSNYMTFTVRNDSGLALTDSIKGEETLTIMKGFKELGSVYKKNREIIKVPLNNIFSYMECSSNEITKITNQPTNISQTFEAKSLSVEEEIALKNIELDEAERERLNMQLSLSYRVIGKTLGESITFNDVRTKEEVTYNAGEVITLGMAEALASSGVGNVVVQSSIGNLNIVTNRYVDITDYVDKSSIPEEFIYYDTDIATGKIIEKYFKVDYTILERILEKKLNKNVLKLELSVNSEDLVGRRLNNSDLKAMINLFKINNLGVFSLEDTDSLSVKTIVSISSVFEQLLVDRIHGKTYGLPRSMTEILQDVKKGNAKGKGNYNWEKLNLRVNNSIPERIVRAPLNSLFQRASNINPVDESSQRRKVTLVRVDGIGGVNAEYSSAEVRNVHPSQLGRLCPIESPEGGRVGLILHLATAARVNSYGVIEAPFFKVDGPNRKIDFSKAYYLTYEEERFLKRAFAPEIAKEDFAEVILYKDGVEVYSERLDILVNEVGPRREVSNRGALNEIAKKIFKEHPEANLYKLKIGLKNWFVDDVIDSIDQDGALVRVKADEIQLLACRPDHMLSATTSNIPFSQYNDGTRLLMGCAMSKQAEPTVASDTPLIVTPLASKIGRETDGVVKAPISGLIKTVSSEAVEIVPLGGGEEPVIVKMQNYRISSEGTAITNRVVVSEGDIVVKGDIIADLDATKNGQLATSVNLRVAYTVYDGYNYEDGIVISDRLLNEDILTSFRITEIKVPFDIDKEKTLSHAEYLKQFKEDDYKNYTKNMDTESPYSVLKKGTRIPKDGIVFVKHSMDVTGYKYESKVEVNREGDGILINTVVSGERNKKILKFHILTEEYIKVGDKLSGRYGNKGCIAKIVPQALMPYTEDGVPMDILLTPLGVPSRMNKGQLIEAQLGAILHDLNIRAEVGSGASVDIPKIKMLTNMYTGDEHGKVQLYDGRTGKPFAQKANVGVTAINKLKHLASHKLAARSTGGRSGYLPNGQPVKGRSRAGGQVIAEMELWAFIADNAVNNLREIQVYKSDDVNSRRRFARYLEGIEQLKDGANFSQSYKKMNSYLMGMGLRMEHLDKDGNVVDIYDDKHTIGYGKKGNKANKKKKYKNSEEVIDNGSNQDTINLLLDFMGEDIIEDIKGPRKVVQEELDTSDINEVFNFEGVADNVDEDAMDIDLEPTLDPSEDSMNIFGDGSEDFLDEDAEEDILFRKPTDGEEDEDSKKDEVIGTTIEELLAAADPDFDVEEYRKKYGKAEELDEEDLVEEELDELDEEWVDDVDDIEEWATTYEDEYSYYTDKYDPE